VSNLGSENIFTNTKIGGAACPQVVTIPPYEIFPPSIWYKFTYRSLEPTAPTLGYKNGGKLQTFQSNVIFFFTGIRSQQNGYMPACCKFALPVTTFCSYCTSIPLKALHCYFERVSLLMLLM